MDKFAITKNKGIKFVLQYWLIKGRFFIKGKTVSCLRGEFERKAETAAERKSSRNRIEYELNPPINPAPTHLEALLKINPTKLFTPLCSSTHPFKRQTPTSFFIYEGLITPEPCLCFYRSWEPRHDPS
jgi:hypothetical protein